jgi:membrane protease YdiL (CAAX protease family)
MGYMPSLAALTVTSLTLGKVGLVTLLKRLIRWRVGWGWYAVAIGGYALLCLAVIPEYALLGGAPALPLLSAQAAKLSPLSLLGMVCLILIVSTLINGEELAWRGFALPRLQARYGSLKASLILGVVWAVFHLPLFWTVGASQFGQSFWGLLIGAVSLSVLLTWVYNHTQGSLLLACLIHASANTWTQVFPIDHAAPLVGWLLSANTALAALLVILAYGPRLVRKSSQSN